MLNGKYLLAKVGKSANYPFFYNSVVSKRIATDLEIVLGEPYIEINTLNRKDSFIIGKAKTFDEEKEVANKVPVEGIVIKNIGDNTNVKETKVIKKMHFFPLFLIDDIKFLIKKIFNINFFYYY